MVAGTQAQPTWPSTDASTGWSALTATWAEIDRLENNDFSGSDVPLGLPAFGLSFNTFYLPGATGRPATRLFGDLTYSA
jgi:hypothetical protein